MAIDLITLEVLRNQFDVITWVYDRGALGKEGTSNDTASA